MLRLAINDEAEDATRLMLWWGGNGAARILAWHERALLLERATGRQSLVAMAQTGLDDEATQILCAVIAALHAPREVPPPALIPLVEWFAPLHAMGATAGDLLRFASATAQRLLADPQDVLPLHGDVHHANVLDFAARGWLAIDPKGLLGERGFDYANIFTNPDIEWPAPPVAVRAEVFDRRLAIVAAAARLETTRLLSWIAAWAGLSAAWIIADGGDARVDIEILCLAKQRLDLVTF